MESVNVWDKRALTAVQVVSSLSFFLGLGEKKKKKLSKAIHFYYYHVISSNFSSFYPSIPLHFLFDFSISKDLCFKINKCTSHFQSLFESSDLQELHGEAISTLGRQELHSSPRHLPPGEAPELSTQAATDAWEQRIWLSGFKAFYSWLAQRGWEVGTGGFAALGWGAMRALTMQQLSGSLEVHSAPLQLLPVVPAGT